MHSRFLAAAATLVLGTFPLSAQAQHVPPLLFAAVLSPALVFLLCIALGFLTRSFRIGVLHAVLVLAWIVLFALASYFVENDYVIWTPLALYLLHAALLLVLVVVTGAKRVSGRDAGAQQGALADTDL
jgi:uncharacterized membrane protein YphA (DoxX/SURF4 family)